jgi:hypothetical protein
MDKLKTGASRNKKPLRNERMAAIEVTNLYLMLHSTLPGSIQSGILRSESCMDYP